MSNFEKVGEFHRVFGHPIFDTLQASQFENGDLLDFRVSLIAEEFKELNEAIENDDRKEIVDALCDILYVTYGFGHVLGVNLDRAFDIVHRSNMTKGCVNEAELKASLEKHNHQATVDCVNGIYALKDPQTTKILKSINFQLPDFSSIDEMLDGSFSYLKKKRPSSE